MIAWDRFPWVAAGLRRKLDRLVGRLPARAARRLAGGRPPSLYRPGTILFYRGHEPIGCVLVRQGQVALECGYGNRAARGVVIEAPAVLGEWHAARATPWPVTARALTPVAVCHLPRPSRTRPRSVSR